jgi:RsiW-degrading membrane proteinase PrsW (M82 family)
MFDESIALFQSFFVYPGVSLNYIMVGILLAIAFGAIWLCLHWPPLYQQPWLWVVAVTSAFLTVVALAFIQNPIQTWLGQLIYNTWSQETLVNWLLVFGIPQMLVIGLVQEGAKMVPIMVWQARSGGKVTPRLGLAIGAIAGAGFGIFEAVWALNQIFGSGWTPALFHTNGLVAIAGFWERFFTVGFHIAVSALVGYGLAKGKGLRFYLIAAGLHAFLNYSVVVRQYIYAKNSFDALVEVEVFVAIVAVAVTAWALMLRSGSREEFETETEEPDEIEDELQD